MTVEKNTIIPALVFTCGLLAGIVFTGVFLPPHVHPGTQIVSTDRAPQPIGPYSQAVASGDFVFLSGQIGIDPATGNLTGNASEQTIRAMANIREVLQESGLGFGDVVQARIYLVNMSDWAAVNTVYGSHFRDSYPARSTIQVAGLPRGALVEIELVARKQAGAGSG